MTALVFSFFSNSTNSFLTFSFLIGSHSCRTRKSACKFDLFAELDFVGTLESIEGVALCGAELSEDVGALAETELDELLGIDTVVGSREMICCDPAVDGGALAETELDELLRLDTAGGSTEMIFCGSAVDSSVLVEVELVVLSLVAVCNLSVCDRFRIRLSDGDKVFVSTELLDVAVTCAGLMELSGEVEVFE